MAKIKQLAPEVINLIAAGEVVERPASVVKELVENSLDAGADHIIIKIEQGGAKLIQVKDNGEGMDEVDAKLAFTQHATSKLKSADDLQRILTLGFRGEALASISAVASIELETKTATSPATKVLVHQQKIRISCFDGFCKYFQTFYILWSPVFISYSHHLKIKRGRMSHTCSHLSPLCIDIAISELDQIQRILHVRIQLIDWSHFCRIELAGHTTV